VHACVFNVCIRERQRERGREREREKFVSVCVYARVSAYMCVFVLTVRLH
jgi:hypothetical protein